MRTRLIRPTFWADAKVAALPVAVRLTFMGLWGLSDDDGYFEWEPVEIAAELYRWAPPRSRPRQVEDHLGRLLDSGRIVRLECGVHGRVPSMPEHRIQSGRHTFPIRDDHRSTCASSRDIPRPPASRSYTETESESVRNGSDKGAAARLSELDEAAIAAGGPVASFAASRVRH